MAVTSPSLTKAIPISHQLVTLRQHLAACGYYPYKRKTHRRADFIVDSSQRFDHTLAQNSRVDGVVAAAVACDRIATLRCVMRPIAWLCVAPMEFGFDPLVSRSEPPSLVFYASLGSEIDNAITLLHAAPTRPAPMSA